MKKRKKQYVEIEKIDWEAVYISLIYYPMMLISIIFLILSLIRQIFRKTIWFFIILIPIINTSLIEPTSGGGFDFGFYLSLFDSRPRINLDWIKKTIEIPVKEE